MTDLGTLGGTRSFGADINNSGQVVGDSFVAGDETIRPFLYSNGVMTDLGSLGGFFASATGINDGGQVVGYADSGHGVHAFFHSNGMMHDLNNLISPDSGWSLTFATDINYNGQITGEGYINGQAHGFIATPAVVPVPAAAWLLGSGLLGLVSLARQNIRLVRA